MQEEPSLSGRVVGDPEDCAVGIVTDEQSAISRDCDAGRSAPYRAFVQHEPGHEVFIDADRLAVFHAGTDHLVSGPPSPIPGPVERGESVASVLGGLHRQKFRERKKEFPGPMTGKHECFSGRDNPVSGRSLEFRSRT
jgi:hypothetical protein